MRKLIILICIYFISINAHSQAVVPSDLVPQSLLTETNDPYFNFQWSLFNYGHTVQQQRSALEFEPICGEGFINNGSGLQDPSVEDFFGQKDHKKCVPQTANKVYKSKHDIGWLNFINQLEKQLKRDVVVAVVDSGLDTSHTDIISNLARIPSQCNDEGKPLQMERQKRKRDKNERRDDERRRPQVPPIDDFDFSKDCFGWNFTNRRFPYGHNLVFDDSINSHGTHIAGILSAERNNGQGIAGISNRIKVLPVKVFRELTPNEAQRFSVESEFVQIMNTVAVGLEYLTESIKNGRTVDVVNLSFGWPKKLTTDRLQIAIQELIKQNVIVVAAAGNDDIDIELFPCSVENVICVGAHTNNGRISSYSNYGSAVDILAPGDSILSLSRTDETAALFTQSDEYDFLSGTSQAAPMVAAVLALAKGTYVNESDDEIKARVLSSAHPYMKTNQKFNLTGIANIEQAFLVSERPYLYPNFKDLSQIKVADQKFAFEIPVKNLWKRAKNVKFKVSSSAGNLQLERSQFNYSTINNFVNLKVAGSILDMNQTSDVSFQVTIQYANEQGQSYSDNFELKSQFYIDLDEASYFEFPLNLSKSVQDAINAFSSSASETFDLGRRLIQQVRPTNLNSEATEYYVSSFAEEADVAGIQSFVLRKEGTVYEQKKLAFLPQSRGYEVFKFDLYSDHPGDEYIIRSDVEVSEVIEEQNILTDKYVEFHVISEDLTKEIDVLRLKPRANLEGRNHVEFLENYYFDFTIFGRVEELTPAFIGFKKDMAKLYTAMSQRPKLLSSNTSNINSLFFMAEGFLSDVDNNLTLNTFSQEDFTAMQLYYLERDKDSDALQVRTMSTPEFKQSLLQQFSSYFYDRGFITSPRVHPDMQLYMWRLLENESFESVNLLVSFAMESQVSIGGEVQKAKGISTNYFFIVEMYFDELGQVKHIMRPLDDFNTGLAFNDRKDDILTYFSLNNSTEGNLIGTKNFKFTEGENSFFSLSGRSRFSPEKRIRIKSPNQDEFLNAGGNLISFKNGDQYFNFYRTQGELLLTNLKDQETRVSTQEMKVTQFLPGINFKELIVPGLYQGSDLYPAIFVNASEIYSRRVYSYVVGEEGNLIAPMNLNIELPQGCFTALPSKISDQKPTMYTFLCQKGENWSLKLVPMKSH